MSGEIRMVHFIFHNVYLLRFLYVLDYLYSIFCRGQITECDAALKESDILSVNFPRQAIRNILPFDLQASGFKGECQAI